MEGPRQEKIKHDGREYVLNARWMTWRKVWNNWGRGTAQLGRLGWCPWEQWAGPAADSQTVHLAQRRLKRRLSPLALRPVVVSGGSGKRLLPVKIPGLCWRFWLGSQEMNLLQQPRYSHLRNDDLVYPTPYGWFPKYLERVSNFRNTHGPQLPLVLSPEHPEVDPLTFSACCFLKNPVISPDATDLSPPPRLPLDLTPGLITTWTF